jgi:hypothetical protein
MGRQNERAGPLGCGHSRGLFLLSQVVLRSVWVDVWVEIKDDFAKRSRGVPGSPIWTSTLRTPSPYYLSSQWNQKVPFSSESGTFQRLVVFIRPSKWQGESKVCGWMCGWITALCGWIKCVWVEC